MNLDKAKIRPFLELIEKFLISKNYETNSELRDEFDKIFNCIIQGKDVVNSFERRKIGISDEEWDTAMKSFFEGIGKDANF